MVGVSRRGAGGPRRSALWNHTILYYTILYSTLLYSTILYLYYTLLYSTVRYYTTLHYAVLYYTLLRRWPPRSAPWTGPAFRPRPRAPPFTSNIMIIITSININSSISIIIIIIIIIIISSSSSTTIIIVIIMMMIIGDMDWTSVPSTSQSTALTAYNSSIITAQVYDYSIITV